MKLLLIDNYDSFTYNLVQYFREIPFDLSLTVFRNDALELSEVENYDAVVFSPGPGLPKDAGLMPDMLERYQGQIPMLGVCLGHQAIAEAFGGKLENLSQVYHGVHTDVEICQPEHPLFEGIPRRFQAGRYHSWVVSSTNFPAALQVLAKDDQGQIMALGHRYLPIWGVQFHPESILTSCGKAILENFIRACAVQRNSLATAQSITH